jgi:hypothetical protein
LGFIATIGGWQYPQASDVGSMSEEPRPMTMRILLVSRLAGIA